MTSTARTLTIAAQGEREILIRRSFAAARHQVYAAYTTPDLLARWLGPRTWEMTVCEIDLRPGGPWWRYVMHGPGGARMVMTGVYREVVAPERLVTTETYDDNWTGGETLNTTVFAEEGDVTTVTTTVVFPSTEARDGALALGDGPGRGRGLRAPRRGARRRRR